MNKLRYLLAVILLVIFSPANAAMDYNETNLFVYGEVENDTTKWFKVPQENVGVSMSVAAGSCSVEVTASPYIHCDDNSAIATPIDKSAPAVSSGNSSFNIAVAASCVRIKCTSGKAKFGIRKN